ncbi:hypothetical protein M2138_002101 [Dysgonomonadaceae bacterium PH5-43]|nr:hypothetical protein [Dysgonomonadaceae bacterium PH5-43]
MKYYISYLVFCCITVFGSYAQTQQLTYKTEAFSSLSTGNNTPFWINNQNWGVVPLESNNFYLRASSHYNQTINKDCSFDLGIDIAGSNKDDYGHFCLQQLYGRVDWRLFRLDIGSREDYTSLLNPNLSSGDFMHSNNARPIPQIKFSMDYVRIPYTKGNMYIKGDFSLGCFFDGQYQEDIAREYNQNYVKNELSHNKSIYFRFGDIENKNNMQFTLAMQHSVKWGGELYKYQYINNEWQYNVTKQPKGLDDLFRVIIAKEGSQSSSYADNAYVAGSQWGAYMFKYDYKLQNKDKISLYLQHFFDDGSGMVFENYKDNLIGIEYNTKEKTLISEVVFEYIYTKHQTGPIHHNIAMDEEHIHLKNKGNGNDNYYNNTDYIAGPSNYGKSIGTPLFLSPEYNKDGTVNFKSNRIIAFHLGVAGYATSDLSYRLKITTGQSWGRYYVPFTDIKKGFASQLDIMYNFKKIENFSMKLSIGFDKGEFFGGDTFGAALTIVKAGNIVKK